MEATLRPYDRGEEVTPFAALGLYHALPYHPTPIPFVLLFLSYLLWRGGGVGAKTSFMKSFANRGRLAWRGRAASAAYPARLNSQM